MSFAFTLKALANSSPGLRLKQPWGKECEENHCNSEGVAKVFEATRDATPSELRFRKGKRAVPQGCRSATLGWN